MGTVTVCLLFALFQPELNTKAAKATKEAYPLRPLRLCGESRLFQEVERNGWVVVVHLSELACKTMPIRVL